MSIKCILFDRDGTLGELDDARFPQTFRPFCDIRELFLRIKAKGYLVGIITNQSSIARGTGNAYDFDGEFRTYQADAWEICPHDTSDNCNCRKPKSGLLIEIAKRLAVTPQECLVVGDRLSDVLCAKNAGAEAVLVLTGYGKNERDSVLERYPRLLCLNGVEELISNLPDLRL